MSPRTANRCKSNNGRGWLPAVWSGRARLGARRQRWHSGDRTQEAGTGRHGPVSKCSQKPDVGPWHMGAAEVRFACSGCCLREGTAPSRFHPRGAGLTGVCCPSTGCRAATKWLESQKASPEKEEATVGLRPQVCALNPRPCSADHPAAQARGRLGGRKSRGWKLQDLLGHSSC